MSESALIAKVVASFYERARQDVIIGYHFRHIADFSTHLPRINAFWEIQLLGVASYQFNPPLDLIGVHIPLKIHRGEVGRWVMLFQETLKQFQAENPQLVQAWSAKVEHFRKAFLQHPQLFPKG